MILEEEDGLLHRCLSFSYALADWIGNGMLGLVACGSMPQAVSTIVLSESQSPPQR